MRLKRQQILFVAAIFAFCRGAAAQGQGMDFSKIESIAEKLGRTLYAPRLGWSRYRTRTRPGGGLACSPVRMVYARLTDQVAAGIRKN